MNAKRLANFCPYPSASNVAHGVTFHLVKNGVGGG
jgi:hypothetical protein